MEALGWAPQPDLETVRVPPRYAHAVMEAWRKGEPSQPRGPLNSCTGRSLWPIFPTGVEADAEP